MGDSILNSLSLTLQEWDVGNNGWMLMHSEVKNPCTAHLAC